jgi:hypothetical protein
MFSSNEYARLMFRRLALPVASILCGVLGVGVIIGWLL